MRIQRLKLENFRGFERLELDFPETGTTILIGDNGSGKSSVLEALAILKSAWIRKKVGKATSTKFPIDEMFKDRKRALSFSIETSIYSATLIKNYQKQILPNIKSKRDDFELNKTPIIVYYPTNRTVTHLDIPKRIRKFHEFDVLSAYEDALGKTNFKLFFEWFREREDYENEVKAGKTSQEEAQSQGFSGTKDKFLNAVRSAIYAFLEGFEDLKIERRPKLAMTIKKNGQRLVINQLSDGEKCTLAMVGDIARRLAIANPQDSDPLQGEGVVLIDEIELHLHPKWQRAIIPKLEKIFPNVQFIVTTHSPQVLGDTKGATVFKIALDDPKPESGKAPFGRDSNCILEDMMEGSEKNLEIKEKISLLFKKIEAKDWEQYRVLQTELESLVGLDDPELIGARVLARRKGLP